MDIESWLLGLGLEKHTPAFRENEIDAAMLPKLTADDLKELGVTALGHRKKLMEAIAALSAAAPQAAPPPSEGPGPERRQLTVMFVDLVGSTQMAGRLDPEDMRNVILDYQQRVAAEIQKVGGNVAKYMGDGVLAYFGWPRAHENEAERAVRAGLAISASVATQKSPLPEPLSARIGIATGLVVVGDLIGSGSSQEETVVGDTPNLAARLQSFATPGQVVISETTHALLGGMFETTDLGTPELKGIRQPQRAFAVLSERALESRFAARNAGGVSRLVGRDAEMELLSRKWRLAQAGQAELVIVSGEAGIGKSRLVEALLEQLRTDAHKLVRFQCLPQNMASPLHAILNQIVVGARLPQGNSRERQRMRVEEVLAASEPFDRRLILLALGLEDATHADIAALSPQQLRFRTLSALERHFERSSGAQPLVIVFEDAHWADPSSLEFLTLLMEGCSAGLLLILTARPGFHHNLQAHPNATAITLNRLDRADIGKLSALLGAASGLPEDIIDEVIARSDGIPLFVEEMISSARAARGSHPQAQGQPNMSIPASLHDSLMSRLDRLPKGKETAQVAAVIGRAFDYATLSAVSARQPADLEQDLESLSSEELVFRQGMIPEASYLFKHALVRDAAYESLLKARRQLFHARLLSVLGQRDGVAAETLAYHAEQAGQTAEAIELWVKAADRAMARPAYHEAIALYANAARLLHAVPDRPERELEVRTQLGLASIAARGHSHPDTAAIFGESLALSERLSRPDLNFVTWYGLWCGHHVASDTVAAAKSARMLFQSAEAVGTSSHRLMGHRALAITALMSGDYRAAHDFHRQALPFRDSTSDREFVRVTGQDQQVSFNSYYALNLWALGNTDDAWARADESLTLAREARHVSSLGYAYMHAVLLSLLADRPERDDLIAEMRRFTTEHRLELWRGYAEQFLAITQLTGNTDQALATLEQARAGLKARNAGLFSSTLAVEAAKRLLASGRPAEAGILLDEAEALIEATGERFAEPECHRIRGRCCQALESGSNQSRQHLERAVALAEERGALHWLELARRDLRQT
jgi:class 3 adenylate cyclase/tetratricopeptide (TPR) repeat protein